MSSRLEKLLLLFPDKGWWWTSVSLSKQITLDTVKKIDKDKICNQNKQ